MREKEEKLMRLLFEINKYNFIIVMLNKVSMILVIYTGL